jgi:4-amino-4-deoxy-L-arabinose transferase-like glycosyltransferase
MSHPEPRPSSAPDRQDVLHTILAIGVLLAFAVPYLLTGLGLGSIENSDDGITACVLRGMARGEHLGEISFQGAVQHSRPLLFYWLGALAVRALGPSELALRLVPALGAVAAVVMVHLLARRAGAGVAGALAGAALFLALHLPVRISRRVGEDTLLAAVLAAATLCYLRARLAPRNWLVWGALVGTAAITKGTVAALAPLCAGLDLGLSARRRELGTRWPWLGGAVALGVAAPWHLWQTLRFGRAFWDDYLDVGVSRAFVRTIPGQTDALFYLRDLLEHDLPLVLVLVVGLGGAAFAVLRGRMPKDDARGLAVAVLVPALLFSAAQSRLPHYMLPAYAPLAALCGAGLAALCGRQWVAATLAGALALGGLWLRALDLYDPDYAPAVKQLALQARSQLSPDESLYVFDGYHTAARFYSERRTVLVTSSPRALSALRSSRLLARSPETVRPGQVDDLARLAASSRDFCCLTPSSRLPPLLAALQATHALRRVDRTVIDQLALVCTRAADHAAAPEASHRPLLP